MVNGVIDICLFDVESIEGVLILKMFFYCVFVGDFGECEEFVLCL